MQHIWRMAALSGTLVMVNKFLPEEILSAIEQYHVNELYVLPPILIKRLYDFPRWKEYDLSSVRCVMCTGGKCSQDIANMIFELFPGSKIDCVFGSALHGGVECVMRCPELALHGRGVADEDVEALDLLGQLRDLLHLFHDGVIVLALKGEHERRADALAVHLDREHGVAGNIAGELHNVGIHVLDDGGGIVLCQQGVGGIEAGLGIHEREEQDSIGFGLVYELESKLGDDGQSTSVLRRSISSARSRQNMIPRVYSIPERRQTNA